MKKQELEVLQLPVELVCPQPLLEALLILNEADKVPCLISDTQSLMLKEVKENWAIISWWITYERCPAIDIRYSPYNTPDFRSRRSIAHLLNQQMDLCKGVFENDGPPLRYWLELMLERKQAEIDAVFVWSPPKFGAWLTRGDEKIYQPGYIDCCRYLLKSLKDERVVPDDLRDFPKHYKLFETALNLAWKIPKSRKCQKFREKYWNPFLVTLSHYIQDVEDRTELGVVNERDGKLYQYARGKPKMLLYKKAKTD